MRSLLLHLLAGLSLVYCIQRKSRQIFYPDRPMVYTEPSTRNSEVQFESIRVTTKPPIPISEIPNSLSTQMVNPPRANHLQNIQQSVAADTPVPEVILLAMPVRVPLDFLPPPISKPQIKVSPAVTADVFINPEFSKNVQVFGSRTRPMMPSASFTSGSTSNSHRLSVATTNTQLSLTMPNFENSIPGRAGQDFPMFYEVPPTSFRCEQQQYPGYYGDVEARCQVVHVCQADGRHDSFLCPNGTLFNQQYFVCDWWFNVNCARTFALYSLNSQLFVHKFGSGS